MGEDEKMTEKSSPWNPENKRIIDTLEEVADHYSGRKDELEKVQELLRTRDMDEAVMNEMAATPAMYTRQPVDEDRASILQHMTTITPLYEDHETHQMKGDVPLELYLDYADGLERPDETSAREIYCRVFHAGDAGEGAGETHTL